MKPAPTPATHATPASSAATAAPPALSRRPLISRARRPHADELAQVPWLRLLEPAARERVEDDLQVADAEAGDVLCKVGRPARFWFGVIDGLLKMSNDNPGGPSITFLGVPPGAWFGEGTLLKSEVYRYNIEALRPSVVAGLSIDTFQGLLETSIPFNRYVMNQLNERLSQFIAAREVDRLSDPDARVARSLAALFNPVLYPRADPLLRITQQELAYLVGLSRQRVNQALRSLEAQSLIALTYGGLRVTNLEGLRRYPGQAASL